MSDSAEDFELSLAEGGLLLNTSLEVLTPKGKMATLTLDAFAIIVKKRSLLRKKLHDEKALLYRDIIRIELDDNGTLTVWSLLDTREPSMCVRRKRPHAVPMIFHCDKSSADGFVAAANERAGLGHAPPKRWCAIVNPISGNGRGVHMLHEDIIPVMDVVGHSVKVRESQYAGHVQDILKDLDMSQFGGIICVGGDGLASQTVSGLLQRPDADELLDRFTLAIVPAGSTCSLAASVGIRTLHTAMLAIIKGCIQPIDVGKVDIYDSKGAPQQTVYCITVVAWGFLSHLLQDTLDKRWMGPLRYAYCGIRRWLLPQSTYTARVKYKEEPMSRTNCQRHLHEHCDGCARSRPESRPDSRQGDVFAMFSNGSGQGVTLSGEAPRLVERQHPFRFISCGVNLGKGCDMPSTGQLHTYGHLADGMLDVILVDRTVGRFGVLRFVLHVLLSGDYHMDMPALSHAKVRQITITPLEQQHICLSIDGEPYYLENGHFVMSVMPAHVNIACGASDLALSRQRQNPSMLRRLRQRISSFSQSSG